MVFPSILSVLWLDKVENLAKLQSIIIIVLERRTQCTVDFLQDMITISSLIDPMPKLLKLNRNLT